MLLKKRICVSVSGGKTSGYMAWLMKTFYAAMFELVFVFANTGMEHEETLIFADHMDREWNLGLVWLEAVVHHGQQKGCTHRVVDYKTASRNGEPFEEVIKKYGIPNQKWLHCTRELKLNPIRSYMASIGWTEYLSAVGIRADEPGRIRSDARDAGIIYPLYELTNATTKPEINDWWSEQPFNLNLEEHRGNCKTCWKKSNRKLIMIAKESPQDFEFTARMEKQYGLAGNNVDGTERVFYRGNTSTEQLLQIAAATTAIPPVGDEDEDGGCTESCEPFGPMPIIDKPQTHLWIQQ